MSYPTASPEFDSKKRIMRRVYGIWFWRSVAPLLAVEAILLVGVAVGVLTQISLRHILLNALAASSGLAAFVKFFVSNFLVKSLQSQLLVAFYAAFLGFFARDVWNAVRRLKGADAMLPTLTAAGNQSTYR
ncbi:MAG: hypothetical protein Q8R35_00430 [bacterium]|nr:hypothetical protein [bacterium]